jgi:hypothetical protein
VPPSNAFFSLARMRRGSVRISVHEGDLSSRSRTVRDDTIRNRRVNGVNGAGVGSFISTRTQFVFEAC